MRIGQLVKFFIPVIFDYCEKGNTSELSSLTDKKYSKNQLNLNYPFCTETSLILPAQSSRYWKAKYQVQGKEVRVCSQWFARDKNKFKEYLLNKELASKSELSAKASETISTLSTANVMRVVQGRYKGEAIGDAQNALIRNILSNLGNEAFNEKAWEETKKYFDNRCAYCNAKETLLMEHAIPINRTALGEHRLGNLVPSCERCNRNKAAKDFREFLGDDEKTILKIEEYMESKNYTPLEKDNEQIERLLNMARQDVLAIASRYTAILNELFFNPSQKDSDEI